MMSYLVKSLLSNNLNEIIDTFKFLMHGTIHSFVDVIGGVAEISLLQPNGDKKKAVFTIRDLT